MRFLALGMFVLICAKISVRSVLAVSFGSLLSLLPSTSFIIVLFRLDSSSILLQPCSRVFLLPPSVFIGPRISPLQVNGVYFISRSLISFRDHRFCWHLFFVDFPKMEKHSATLSSLCRFGGQKCNETMKCNAGMFANTLQSVIKIDCEQNNPNVHPKYICGKCERLSYRLEHGGE